MISYDVKLLYHTLAAAGVSVRFSELHDIRQAAFLLDPLRRDRSLSGLVGGEFAAPIEEVAAMRQVYGWQTKAFEEKPKVKDIALRFDFPLIYHLFMMEHYGIKLDTGLLKKMSKELGDKLAELEQQMYTMAGYEFNIGSPSQLSEVLFTKLQLPTAALKKAKLATAPAKKSSISCVASTRSSS